MSVRLYVKKYVIYLKRYSSTGFFPVHLWKFLRTPLFVEHLRWLLPQVVSKLHDDDSI